MDSEISFNCYRSVIDAAVEGIITINKHGVVLFMNPAAEMIFGYEQKEVINKNIEMLMPAPYKGEHDNYLSNYRASQKPKIIGIGREVLGLRKSGQEFPMWLSVSEFYEDGEQYFAGLVSDLSVEKSFLHNAQTYKNIFEHSLNEIFLFNVDTLKFIHVNQGALLNLQYSLLEMKNKTPVDIKPAFTNEEFLKIIAPLVNKELNKVIFITRQQRKDGSIYPVEVHLELTEHQGQKVFLAIILDITERISAKEKVRINEEKLAHMDRLSVFGEMTAGIAHEINQPLTAISAYASAGLRRVEAEELDASKLKELFEKISAATQRTNKIISGLRQMLNPENDEFDNLDINELIHDSIDLIKCDSRSSEFEFKLQLSNDLPMVLGNAVQLQQVILNLIRNSMDAAIGSDIETNQIIISSKQLADENRIKISVKDYGSGINSKIEDNLFAPFQTTKKSGMSIGLSICQTIIQSHHGRIWVTKNKDRGVTFHFTVQIGLLDDE